MKRLGLAILIALACAAGASQASGEATARGTSAANTLVATLVDISEPGSSRKDLEITGQVMAPSHKFAPKKCRANRTFDIDSPAVGGGIIQYGSSYPTRKSGRFTVQFPLEYAYPLEEGAFHRGSVPESGGTATFIAHSDSIKVQRSRGSLQSYTCRPLSITLQYQAPPLPQD
jgi:hypothetical protein